MTRVLPTGKQFKDGMKCLLLLIVIHTYLLFRQQPNYTQPKISDIAAVQPHNRFSEFRTRYAATLFHWEHWAHSNEMFAFLHVGKAGGSTLFCEFLHNAHIKHPRHCPHPVKSNARFPSYSQHYDDTRVHQADKMTVDRALKYGVYVTNLRNPITRFISAYNFDKIPSNKYVHQSYPPFGDCFQNWSIAKFLTIGLSLNQSSSNNDAIMSPLCRKIAQRFARGNIEEFPSHITYNYQHYEREFLFAAELRSWSPHLLAIRTGQMREDLYQLETLFRTGMLFANTTNATTTTNSLEASRVGLKVNYTLISQDAYSNLCHHLCADIQAYKRTLYRSENLDKTAVLEELEDLKQFCPTETMELRTDCT